MLSDHNDFGDRRDFNIKERGVRRAFPQRFSSCRISRRHLQAYVYVIAIRKAATKMQIRRVITSVGASAGYSFRGSEIAGVLFVVPDRY